jgi:hypothetical protein
MNNGKVISIPIAVHVDYFKWQLDLFWFNHQRTYPDAEQRVHAVVIKRNHISEPRHEKLEWPTTIPHTMCESMYDYLPLGADVIATGSLGLPLNIQVGLAQVLASFDDDQVIEVLDCDMFHFRPHPKITVGHDELHVCDLYEAWHLKSLSEHKNVIERYFEHGGGYYNGGFVPIVGTVRTFKKIIYEWTAVHIDILKSDASDLIKWWAGMYALQAACEKAKVTMTAKDHCYIPGANTLSPEHYISHYCIDAKFTKKVFPNINIGTFENNIYYARILKWLAEYLTKDCGA